MPSPRRHLQDSGARLAAALVALEGAALGVYGAYLLVSTLLREASNTSVASGSAAFFLSLSALVLLVAWGLWRAHGWSRGAAVFVQLLMLAVGWGMLTGGLPLGGVLLAAVAGVVLAGVLLSRC